MDITYIKSLFDILFAKATKKFNINPKTNLHFKTDGFCFRGLAGIKSIDFYVNANFNVDNVYDYFKFLVFHEYAHVYHYHWLKKLCFYSFVGLIYGFIFYNYSYVTPDPFSVIVSSLVVFPLLIYDPFDRYFENQADDTALRMLKFKQKYIDIRNEIRNVKF